jgi:ribosomal protein S18 acetylase RimI-like enzyme
MDTLIREYQESDMDGVVDVWFRSAKREYTYLPTWRTLSLEEARDIFVAMILRRTDIWVATNNECIVAYLALNGSYIDRLYVEPGSQRQGWGSKLIDKAKFLSPDGLELHTHQENVSARALYETTGFTAINFGISPPPDPVPDVEYRWRPEGNA